MILRKKTNVLRIAAAIAAIHFLFLPTLRAQALGNREKIDSLFSEVLAKYDAISNLVPTWNKKWEDSHHNKLILVPIIKCKLDSGAQKNLSIADTLSNIVAIDSTGRSVYIYNISNSSLSLKGSSSVNVLNLLDQQKNQDRKLFIYFFDRDAKDLDILASCAYNKFEKFSSRDISNTGDILQIIIHKFGSLKNFETYSLIETQQPKIARGIREKFSNFTIENNWQFYSHFFAEDHSGNLSLLLSEIQQATGVSGGAINKIKTEIEKKIESGNKIADFQITSQIARDARYGKLNIIPFLGFDVLPILSCYLSGQELDAYMTAYKINSGATFRMQSSLSARFKGKKSSIQNYVVNHIVFRSKKPMMYSLYNDQKNPARLTTF